MCRLLRRVFGGDRPIRRAHLGSRLRAVVGACLLGMACIGGVRADDSSFLTVTIGNDETIRQVAEKYLSDPNLWPEILRSSGVKSIADLHPGMQLKIPVNEITDANRALIESLGQIQKANQAGAQLFAPDEIGRAVDLHEQALEKRKARQWVETKDLALASYDQATSAIEISEANRDQAAEALVTDRAGNVEGQRPQDLSWRGLDLRSILIEEEKVRTLSDSTAQITFRDASRLRLNANSNAVIRQMRFDPLKKTEEAKVSLVEGDFYALLSGEGNDRSHFNVEIPNVNATIDSGNFWVSNTADSAKFANYDVRPVEVAAAGSTVTLGKNEGTIVDQGAKPREKVAVLPPPELTAPDDEGPVYVTTPTLAWSPVDGAAGYWIEIATDQNFDRIVENDFGVDGPKRQTKPLDAGEYFWRVSALDGFGLPGVRSDARSFRISPDDSPPFLKINAPAPGVIIRKASLTVSGESEPGAKVTVNGAPAEVDANGAFSAALDAAPGDNLVTVVATDPAGNETKQERHFTYMPDETSVVAFDPAIRRIGPSHFLANGDVISLNGTTTPNAEIEVRSGDQVRASATSNGQGVFRINVPLAADDEQFGFAVIAPSGFTTVEDMAVTVDRDPPEIAFDQFPPRLTAKASIKVSGTTEPDATLTLNGAPLALDNGHFEEAVTLQPGANTIELIATDRAGNVKVDKSVVILDQDPPKLVSADNKPASSGGQAVLEISVVAEDASGLAKAAPFVVVAGDQTFSGYLRYNRAAKSYQGSVVLPETMLASARLARIELQDDAGNSRTYEIQ